MRSLARFSGADAGRELVLGVRPQDIVVKLLPAEGDLLAKVELIQLVGSEKLLEVALPGRVRVTADVRAELAAAVSQPIGIEFDEERVHLFDAATQRSILAG